MFLISLIIQVGMWTERFVIVIISLHRDFLPSSWGMYYPTRLGLGDAARDDRVLPVCFLLFARFLPVISIVGDARTGAFDRRRSSTRPTKFRPAT